MRYVSTPQESQLWERLRRNALGIKFRRQHVIDHFIVDFFCIDASLVVEIDGPIHNSQQEKDAIREEHLRRCGYRILRFTNEQVETNLEEVVARIGIALKQAL